ncbi:MAG: DNA primase [Patescibacteria group bacterium]
MTTATEKIKEKIDIVELIGSYLPLQKAGSNFKGKCPFHNEKTPSFFVSYDRQNFYCFGCGVGGDIFSFVEKYDGLDFKGALKVLADKAGIALSQYTFDSKEKDDKQLLYEINEKACIFLQNNLSSNEKAVLYLYKRGFNDETIKNFRIGFANASWDELCNYLVEAGYKKEKIFKAGLCKKKDDRYYDIFRSRIMFPISDFSGKVVAFSGRIFGDESEAKYLNSPETPIFKKGEVLYGLDKAKQEIRNKNYCILVEGQIDLVSMHQNGYKNTVASSGTALSEKGLTSILRMTTNLLLAFDPDVAGISASGRASKIALPMGFNVKVALLPKDYDPADLLGKNPELLKEAIKESKHIIDFYLDLIHKSQYDDRKKALETRRIVLPYVALIENKMDQSFFIKKIAEKMGVSEESIWFEIAKIETTPKFYGANKETEKTNNNYDIKRNIALIYKYLTSQKNTKLTSTLLSRYKEIVGEDIPNIDEKNDKEMFEFDALLSETDTPVFIEEMLNRLELIVLQKELTDMTEKLKKAEIAGEEDAVRELILKSQELSLKLEKIKQPNYI